jgi:hypothetical protein
MNERIKEIARQAGLELNPANFDHKKFAELMVREFENYINTEIDRLNQYRNSLPESEINKRGDVDICIEKCYDNIQGIREHFGVEE